MHLYKSGDAIKHEKGQDNLMEISSFMTELRKMWAVIQKEDTEHNKSLIVYYKERA